MKIGRSVFFSAAGAFSERVGGVFVGLACNILIARSTNILDYGKIQEALAIVFAAGGIGLICSAQSVSPLLSRFRRRSHLLFSKAFNIRAAASVASYIIVCLVGLWNNEPILYAILGIFVFYEPLALGALYLYSISKPLPVSYARLLGAFVRLAWVFSCAILEAPIVYFAGSWPIEAILAALFPFWTSKRVMPTETSKEIVHRRARILVLSHGLRAWPSVFLGTWIVRLDRLVFPYLLSPALFSSYAGTATMVDQWNAFGQLLVTSLAPQFLFKDGANRQLITKAIRFALIVAAISFVFAIVSFPFRALITSTIYGERFVGAADFLAAGLFSSIVIFADYVGVAALYYAKRTTLLLVKQFASFVLTILVVFFTPTDLKGYSFYIGIASSALLFWLLFSLSSFLPNPKQ